MTWRTAKLGRLAAESGGLIQTGPFGSQLHEHEYVAEGVPVIMPKDIIDGRVDEATVARVTEQTAARLERHQLRRRTIVLPRRGAITKRAFIRESQEGWLCGTGCLQIVLDTSPVIPEFLYYYMEQGHAAQWLEQHAVGTTMLNLSTAIVADFPVTFPSTRVQRRIAEILSAYDDLIENNRRRMELLADAAQQLYQEWFVRLRFPGREHTRVLDGVPKGWERTSVSAACESLEDGDWIESKDQGGDDYRLLQVSNVGVGDFVETGNFRYITEDTFRRINCREVRPGHILISRMPKPIGRAWLVTEMPWRMVTAVDVAILVPKTPVDGHFLLHHLNSTANLELCERRAVGATRLRVGRKHLGQLPIVLPPASLRTAFADNVEPLHRQRTNLRRQNDKLREARDLLLPRLMSGELTA